MKVDFSLEELNADEVRVNYQTNLSGRAMNIRTTYVFTSEEDYWSAYDLLAKHKLTDGFQFHFDQRNDKNTIVSINQVSFEWYRNQQKRKQEQGDSLSSEINE
tara:strand:+ start:167 stop:475 length:309 start_codon:yes stop_codon:yes gene_type:complete